MYGIDWDGPVPSASWGSSTNDDVIVVPETEINTEHDQLFLLQHNINSLRQTENYGIDIYENTLQFVLNEFIFTPCTQ